LKNVILNFGLKNRSYYFGHTFNASGEHSVKLSSDRWSQPPLWVENSFQMWLAFMFRSKC